MQCVAVGTDNVYDLGFGGKRVGDAVFQPLWMALLVPSGEEASFVVLVVDVVDIVVENDLGFAILYQCVNDALFCGCQGIEASKEDALITNFSH